MRYKKKYEIQKYFLNGDRISSSDKVDQVKDKENFYLKKLKTFIFIFIFIFRSTIPILIR